jgi:K+-sensing histidine kinase KdpD
MPSFERLQTPRNTFVAAALGPVALCAAMYPFRESLTPATAALAIVLVVVAAAATGQRWGGAVAAVAGALSFDFFLTEPYLTLTIQDPDDVEVTVLLVVIGLAVSEVALWGRRQQDVASARAGYLDGVLEASGAVALRRGTDAQLTDEIARRIAVVLDLTDCRYVAGRPHDTRYAVMHRDGIVERAGRVVEVQRDGLPFDELTVLPVVDGEEVLGHFVLTAASRISRPTSEQCRVAVLLADQVAGGRRTAQDDPGANR